MKTLSHECSLRVQNSLKQTKSQIPLATWGIWCHSPSPCKKINPVTIKAGCQLNSASPPSHANPSLKWRTHVKTKTIEANPATAAAHRHTRNFFKPSIAILYRQRDSASLAGGVVPPTNADRVYEEDFKVGTGDDGLRSHDAAQRKCLDERCFVSSVATFHKCAGPNIERQNSWGLAEINSFLKKKESTRKLSNAENDWRKCKQNSFHDEDTTRSHGGDRRGRLGNFVQFYVRFEIYLLQNELNKHLAVLK